MAGLLFLPGTQLDGWLEAGQVDIDGDGLSVPAEGLSVGLKPAFRFVKLLEGQDDQKLLAGVRTEVHLRELGAEACGDSVLLGETAYEVVPGFVLELKGPSAPKDKKEEADLLSRFFLENTR